MNLENFVTWEILATYGGSLLMVSLLTQALKGYFKNVPTQLLSYALALLVLYPALYFTGQLDASGAVLALFNAAVVSLASNGAFAAIQRTTGGVKK